MPICPLCGSEHSKIVCDCRDVPLRLNSLPGLIHRCNQCGFLYKETFQKSLAALDEIYQYTVEETQVYFGPMLKGYDIESPEMKLSSRVLEETRQLLGPDTGEDSRLLDVGCATGALLDRSRAFGFSPYGVELNPHFARYAREEFNIPVIAGELSLEHFEPGMFSAITMMDLIEHVPDPLALLDTAWQLLRPGGLLVVYTPNHHSLIAQLSLLGYRLTGGSVRAPAFTIFGTNHVCFFDHKSLPVALEKAGYTLDVMHRIPYDTQHQGEIESGSLLALGIKSVEAIGTLINRPYRLLAFARKPN